MATKSVVVVGLALMLAACGFHLRGSIQPIDATLNPMVIESANPGSALLPPLRRALVDSGAELASGRSGVGSLLRITVDGMDQRVTAVSAQGRPREMELIYRVEFELHGPDGILVEPRTVTLSREFAVDERDVLGKAQEAEVLRAGLVRDMVAALTRQLASVRTP